MKKTFTRTATKATRNMLVLFALMIVFAANAQLSGTYTIGSSQAASAISFQTFKPAVDILTRYGINSHVVFNVTAGTYNEQVIIPAIAGASPVNMLTPDGGTGNQLPVLLNKRIN